MWGRRLVSDVIWTFHECRYLTDLRMTFIRWWGGVRATSRADVGATWSLVSARYQSDSDDLLLTVTMHFNSHDMSVFARAPSSMLAETSPRPPHPGAPTDSCARRLGACTVHRARHAELSISYTIQIPLDCTGFLLFLLRPHQLVPLIYRWHILDYCCFCFDFINFNLFERK